MLLYRSIHFSQDKQPYPTYVHVYPPHFSLALPSVHCQAGGADIEVTLDNVDEYVALVVESTLVTSVRYALSVDKHFGNRALLFSIS